MRPLVLLDESIATAFLCSDRKEDVLQGWVLERESGRCQQAVVTQHATQTIGTLSKRTTRIVDVEEVSHRVQLAVDEEQSRIDAKLDGEEAMLVFFVRPMPKLLSATSPFFRTCAGTNEPTLCSLEALECINATCSTSQQTTTSTAVQGSEKGAPRSWRKGWKPGTSQNGRLHGTWLLRSMHHLMTQSCLIRNFCQKWQMLESFFRDGHSGMLCGGALPSPFMRKRYGWLCTLDIVVQITVDGCLGLYLAYILSSYTHLLVTGLEQLGDQAPAAFTDLMHWMMKEPGGLKLHEETSFLYGYLFLQSLSWWSWAVLNAFPIHMHSSLSFFIVVLCIGGLSAGLAISHDFFALSTWIVDGLHFCLSAVYMFQLRGIAWAWLLVRGKRKNKVEGRPDTMVEHLPLEHVIAGVLVLAPLVLILPTTVLFYLFACILNMTVHLIRQMLQIGSTCLRSFPVVGLGVHLFFPCFFPAGLQVELVQLPLREPELAIRIASTANPISNCFADLRSTLHSDGNAAFPTPLTLLEGLALGKRVW